MINKNWTVIYYFFNLLIILRLDFCYFSTIYNTEDVGWNIRKVKLKFQFFPEIRLYILMLIIAVYFLFILKNTLYSIIDSSIINHSLYYTWYSFSVSQLAKSL